MKILFFNINKTIIILLAAIVLIFSAVGNSSAQSEMLEDLKISEREYINYKFNFFEGNKQKMLGNVTEAIQHFQKCCEIIPTSAASCYELAALHYTRNDIVTALLYAKQAVKFNPDNIYYDIMLAQLYEENGVLAEATSVYKNMVKKYPARSDIHIDYAILLTSIGKSKTAIKELNKLEEKTGVTEIVSLEKERIYVMNGMPDKALEEIEKLIKAFPFEPRYYGMLAETYTSMKEYDKALVAYNKLIELDKDNGRVHLALAEFYRVSGDLVKSYDELKKAFGSTNIEVDFKVKTLLNIFALSITDPSAKNHAYELVNILLETHPDNPKAHTIYADFLIRDGKYEQARDELRVVTQNDKEKYLIWEQLLLLEGDLKDYTSMFKESQEAIDYFPNQPTFYLFKGIAGTRLKKYAESIKTLKEGVKLVVDNQNLKVQFYSNLGEVLFRNNEYSESDSVFELVLSFEPDNKLVLNNFSYYLSVRGDSLEKAERMSKQCIEMEPVNSTYLDTYAWTLYKLNKQDLAKEYIEKSIRHGGDKSPVIIEHYGDILYKLGDKENALKQWKLAKEKGIGSEFLNEKIEKGILVE